MNIEQHSESIIKEHIVYHLPLIKQEKVSVKQEYSIK